MGVWQEMEGSGLLPLSGVMGALPLVPALADLLLLSSISCATISSEEDIDPLSSLSESESMQVI